MISYGANLILVAGPVVHEVDALEKCLNSFNAILQTQTTIFSLIVVTALGMTALLSFRAARAEISEKAGDLRKEIMAEVQASRESLKKEIESHADSKIDKR